MGLFSGIGLDLSGHQWVVTLISLVSALGIAFWTYRRTNPPLPASIRALLFILRAAAIFLLVFVVLEPILSLFWRRVEEPVVAVLVDTSASMSISEESQDRFSQSQEFLKSPIIEKIASKNQVKTYQFAEDAYPWQGDSLKAAGLATDIAQALETVRGELREENLAAMVVLTDGANNLGRNPVQRAEVFGLPIFPVGVGSSDPRRDISVKEVEVNEVVYVESRVPVEVTIQSRGHEGQKVPVTLSDKEIVLDSRQVTLVGEGREQRVPLEFVPTEEGIRRLTVTIPLQEGELAAENNRRDVSLKILKSKIRVLLVWGSPSWDFAFLRRSLERDPNVELTPLVMKKQGGYFLGAFPQKEAKLFQHDAVILGDLNTEHLGTLQGDWLYRFVAERGNGLLFLYGPQLRFGPGSPLVDLIPVTITGGKPRTLEDRFGVELTPAGRVHPATAVVDDVLALDRIWGDLPPFLGLGQFGLPKPGATVLAVHPALAVGDQKAPLIVVHRVGVGKTMLMAAYPTWRWDFMLKGLGRGEQTYDRFWSNVVRWLTTREEGRLVRVYPAGNVFRSGQRIAFQARLYDENYRPMDRAQVNVMAMRKETPGRVEAEGDLFESGRRDGQYRGELGVLSPGEYLYRAEVSLGGQKVGSDQGEFLVEEYSLEFEKVELNEKLLRSMAQVSGGAYYALEDVEELPAHLQFRSREVSRKLELELWNHPGMLICLILLLAVEWTIRKRNRLM